MKIEVVYILPVNMIWIGDGNFLIESQTIGSLISFMVQGVLNVPGQIRETAESILRDTIRYLIIQQTKMKSHRQNTSCEQKYTQIK